MTTAVAQSAPTLVLVGALLTLDDGSRVDSRQATKDAATARAIRKALVSSRDWWAAVASVVIPTLSDGEGGFALAHVRTIASVTEDGRIRRIQLPRYPRAGGGEDYIYSLSRVGETVRGPKRAKPRARKGRARRRNIEPRASPFPRIRIDTTGSVLRSVSADRSAYPGLQMIVLPDTARMREDVDAIVSGRDLREAESGAWDDPHRYLRLAVKRAVCTVTGLARGGRWEDPAGLEAARLLLLERFDLKVGLWDLVLDPVLRSAVLETRSTPRVPEGPADVPRLARRRAEQEAGGVERALHDGLEPVGWKLTRFGLQHAIARNAGSQRSDQHEYPYLRLLVSAREVRVVVWHWRYTTFDINAFVDRRQSAFDAISVLPVRKPFRASSARTLAKYRKPGHVVYDQGRPLDDPRWVVLWSAPMGWADVDTDWARLAIPIAERTVPWVTLLIDAVAECLGVERATLKVIRRGSK